MLVARAARSPGYSLAAPWRSGLPAALVLALGLAALVGILAAAVSPLAPAALLLGAPVALTLLVRPRLGLYTLVAVVAVLPFGVIPVRIGVQFTFVDAILGLTYLACLGRIGYLLRGTIAIRMSWPGLFLTAFVAVICLAFIVGAAYSAPSPEIARRVAKLVASLLLFLVALNLLRTTASIYGLVRALMVGGAVAGAVGAFLWVLPDGTQLRLLSALQVLGYPGDSILRYVPGENDTYSNQLRATGTAVDPNVFGGTLMLALALVAMQWVARERLFSRPVLLLLALPMAAGLLASYSRSSWLGLALAVLAVGSMRYRRIWLWAALAGLVLLVSPIGQDLVERFVGGLTSADPATALRLGEYRNALTLISRYPFLGIGFGASPDIDVTAGVSSVYLLVGEQTGLIGLAFYLAALLSVLGIGLAGLKHCAHDERRHGVLSGLVAAFVAALVAGFLDHYFANHAFPHAVALFWLYAALVVALARTAESPNPSLLSDAR